jgi:F-type H+-transporting ATPase subunit gamma
MAGSKEIRTKIKSVQSTRKITKAMEMVAASKMRKAQERMRQARPYGDKIRTIAAHLAHANTEYRHPFLLKREIEGNIGAIVVTSDKGLCGALNTNVFRLAAQFDPETTIFITAGRKAAQFVARTKRPLVAEFAYGDSPTFPEARAIAACARDLFLTGDVDQVLIVTTRFVNTLTQEAVTIEYLPVGQITGLKVAGAESEEALAADTAETVFEPSAEFVLGYLLGHYLNIYIYNVLLNAKASEQSARMVSMKNATDSAQDLIKALRLEYNKLRQGNITRELLEIAGGQAE